MVFTLKRERGKVAQRERERRENLVSELERENQVKWFNLFFNNVKILSLWRIVVTFN